MRYRVNAIRSEIGIIEAIFGNMDEGNKAAIANELQAVVVPHLEATLDPMAGEILDRLLDNEIAYLDRGQVYWHLMEAIFPLCGLAVNKDSEDVFWVEDELAQMKSLRLYDLQLSDLLIPQPEAGPLVYICRPENLDVLRAEALEIFTDDTQRATLVRWVTDCMKQPNKSLVLCCHEDEAGA